MFFRSTMRVAALTLAAVAVLALSGCLYPDEQRPGNDASAREAVLTVQDAVDRYQEQTGLLPIQNASEDVPAYEKYKVDFGKLKRMDFISSVPPAAFESGGDYQFLIIDEETNPQVKLLDLGVYQTVADVQRKVNEYRDGHGGANPAGDRSNPGYENVDFGKLGIGSPEIRSMYSRQRLDLIVDEKGQVFVDYGIDIATAIRKTGEQPGANDDLRRALIDASYFVPVKSPEYRWAGEVPQPVAKP